MLVEYEQAFLNNANTIELQHEEFIYKPKVDSHNTITIRPIKDSWSKEELQFLKGSSSNHLKFIYERMAFKHKENVNYDYMIKLKEIVDWIDENL